MSRSWLRPLPLFLLSFGQKEGHTSCYTVGSKWGNSYNSCVRSPCFQITIIWNCIDYLASKDLHTVATKGGTWEEDERRRGERKQGEQDENDSFDAGFGSWGFVQRLRIISMLAFVAGGLCSVWGSCPGLAAWRQFYYHDLRKKKYIYCINFRFSVFPPYSIPLPAADWQTWPGFTRAERIWDCPIKQTVKLVLHILDKPGHIECTIIQKISSPYIRFSNQYTVIILLLLCRMMNTYLYKHMWVVF
jgi:hypothetical protein